MGEKSRLVTGGEYLDSRGKLIFFNQLDLTKVKRFYIIEHPDVEIVRAWQGHKKEQKWFFVTAGAFKIVLVQPDNWENPSKELNTEEFLLRASEPQVLHVPGQYANGFKALEPKSKIMVFSSFTVDESAKDDFRFDKDLWYNWR